MSKSTYKWMAQFSALQKGTNGMLSVEQEVLVINTLKNGTLDLPEYLKIMVNGRYQQYWWLELLVYAILATVLKMQTFDSWMYAIVTSILMMGTASLALTWSASRYLNTMVAKKRADMLMHSAAKVGTPQFTLLGVFQEVGLNYGYFASILKIRECLKTHSHVIIQNGECFVIPSPSTEEDLTVLYCNLAHMTKSQAVFNSLQRQLARGLSLQELAQGLLVDGPFPPKVGNAKELDRVSVANPLAGLLQEVSDIERNRVTVPGNNLGCQIFADIERNARSVEAAKEEIER